MRHALVSENVEGENYVQTRHVRFHLHLSQHVREIFDLAMWLVLSHKRLVEVLDDLPAPFISWHLDV